MILIGLSGLKRSGKSTVARYLVEQYGFGEVSFAAPMYRAIATMIGIDIQHLQDETSKEADIPWLGRSPRYLLQTLGSEWGRGLVRDDIWILIALRHIERHRGMGMPGVIVSDVRFDNEAQFIISQGGQVWIISRPCRAVSGRDGHASERGISPNIPSRGIVNAAGFPTLYKRVDELLDTLQQRAAP